MVSVVLFGAAMAYGCSAPAVTQYHPDDNLTDDDNKDTKDPKEAKKPSKTRPTTDDDTNTTPPSSTTPSTTTSTTVTAQCQQCLSVSPQALTYQGCGQKCQNDTSCRDTCWMSSGCSTNEEVCGNALASCDGTCPPA